MHHNCTSLCSLCEGKDGEKTINISLVFMTCRNENQHFADYLFGSNLQVSLCLRRLRRSNFGSEQFLFYSGRYYCTDRITETSSFYNWSKNTYIICGYINELSVDHSKLSNVVLRCVIPVVLGQ